jgi:hypothetical protein
LCQHALSPQARSAIAERATAEPRSASPGPSAATSTPLWQGAGVGAEGDLADGTLSLVGALEGLDPAQQEFLQFGKDLQSGDLSTTRSDLATNDTPHTTGFSYITPQQTDAVIQQELQQLHQNAGTIGLGLLTPQQTYSIIQPEMQQLQQNVESTFAQDSSQTGSSGLSVLG